MRIFDKKPMNPWDGLTLGFFASMVLMMIVFVGLAIGAAMGSRTVFAAISGIALLGYSVFGFWLCRQGGEEATPGKDVR